MRRAWLVLLAAVLLPVASAHAAQPIEGQWLAGQSVVEFRATGAGAYAGVVRVGTFPRCGDPGAVVVPQLTGTGGSYAGTLRWSGAGCQDAFDAPATLTVTGPLGGAPTGGTGDVASLCAPAAPGGPAGCLYLQRAPSMPCTDGIDNDLDGAVDGADPACLVLTGASPQTLAESADPQLTVTTTTGGVLEGRAGDRTRVAFQVRVTPPVARDVHVTTTLVTSGADAATDLAVAGGIGRVTLAPRQPAAEVAIDV